MSRLIDLHLHQNPYLHSTADGVTVLPSMASCAHDQKYGLEIRFRTSCSVKIFIHVNIRITKKSDLPLDLSLILPHIAPQISKEHD